MKSKIILVICGIMMAIVMQAQDIIVKSPSPNLKVEFKRCIENTDMTFIDILITNTSKQDTKMECRGWITIYDDEGNIYNNDNTSSGKPRVYIATSNTDNQPLNSVIEIPAGIAFKARIIVRDGFDKYATKLTLLKINFNWNMFNTRSYGMWTTDSFELRNLPIIKE